MCFTLTCSIKTGCIHSTWWEWIIVDQGTPFDQFSRFVQNVWKYHQSRTEPHLKITDLSRKNYGGRDWKVILQRPVTTWLTGDLVPSKTGAVRRLKRKMSKNPSCDLSCKHHGFGWFGWFGWFGKRREFRNRAGTYFRCCQGTWRIRASRAFPASPRISRSRSLCCRMIEGAVGVTLQKWGTLLWVQPMTLKPMPV